MKKNRLKWGVLLVALFSLAACGTETKNANEGKKSEVSVSTKASSSTLETSTPVKGNIKEFTASNGEKLSLNFPEQWKDYPDAKEINPDAAIFMYSTAPESYVATIVEDKADFKDFATYVDLVNQNFETTLESMTDKQVRDVMVNNHKAKRIEFSAEVQGLNLHYIYYIIEGNQNFYQIYGWSTNSKFDQVKGTLEQIMQSFQVDSAQ